MLRGVANKKNSGHTIFQSTVSGLCILASLYTRHSLKSQQLAQFWPLSVNMQVALTLPVGDYEHLHTVVRTDSNNANSWFSLPLGRLNKSVPVNRGCVLHLLIGLKLSSFEKASNFDRIFLFFPLSWDCQVLIGRCASGCQLSSIVMSSVRITGSAGAVCILSSKVCFLKGCGLIKCWIYW